MGERALLATATELLMVEDTEFLALNGTSKEVVIVTFQEDMERSLFYVFTPEADASNHQEQHKQPKTAGSSIEVSTRPFTFSDLIQIPKWEKILRQRAKPPTIHLTNIEHINYIAAKKNETKPKGKDKKQKWKIPLHSLLQNEW